MVHDHLYMESKTDDLIEVENGVMNTSHQGRLGERKGRENKLWFSVCHKLTIGHNVLHTSKA